MVACFNGCEVPGDQEIAALDVPQLTESRFERLEGCLEGGTRVACPDDCSTIFVARPIGSRC
jgi:hypothetical protein